MKNIIANLALLAGALCIPTGEENRADNEIVSVGNEVKLIDQHNGADNGIASVGNEVKLIDQHNGADNGIVSVGDEVKLINQHYGPQLVDCPPNKNALKRGPNKVFPEEIRYIEKRYVENKKAILKFFERTISQESDFSIDLNEFMEKKPPKIGITFSGGGYRSVFSAAGQLLGLDDRVENKSALSGILQASSYITSTNEGNWLLGSLIAHGFPVVTELFDSPDMFNFSNGLANPYGDDVEKNKNFIKKISDNLADKYNQGFPVSPVDILGRALSYQLLGEKKDEKWGNFTLSSIIDSDAFKNAEMPYPLLIAQLVRFSAGSSVKHPFNLEMGPYRVTSWDKYFDTSQDTKYFGSYQDDSSEVCYNQFDNLGFLMSMGSTFESQFIKDLYEPIMENLKTNEYLSNVQKSMFGIPENSEEDTGYHFIHKNDPFAIERFKKHYKSEIYTNYHGDTEDMIDLNSLSIPQRDIDVVFLFDHTKDGTSNLPTFSAVSKALDGLSETGVLNPIPSFTEWFDPNYKISTKPGFIGCNATNTPLFIYIPTGFFYEETELYDINKTIFSDKEVRLLIKNGLGGVSLTNQRGKDNSWATCVACAIMNHNLLKHDDNSPLPEKCHRCFEKYCITKKREVDWSPYQDTL